MSGNIEILLGVILIVIYAMDRFNSPPTIRASTTAYRYYLAALTYLLIYLVSFYVFTKYPYLLKIFGIDESAAHDSVVDPASSKVIFIAMILSLLVPKVPLISQLDEKLRNYLHRLASIPYEAIRLSKSIQSRDFKVTPAIEKDVLDALGEQGFTDCKTMLETEDAMIRDWVKLVSLMIQVQAWERKTNIATFVQERQGQLDRIKEHYKRLVPVASYTFSIRQKAKEHPDIDALQDAASNFRNNLISEEKALFAEICDLISQGVLKCCFTLNARIKALKEIGFHLDDDPGTGLSINQVFTLFGLLLFLVITNFILFHPPDANVERVILMVAMIVSIYSAAVICAACPKQQWAFFQYSEENGYPVISYVVSGLCAALASIALSLFFKTLAFASDPAINGLVAPFISAFSDFTTNSYPWLTMSFVTAITTAFLIDWKKPDWIPHKGRRYIEGAIQLTVLVAAAKLVHWWLTGLSASEVFTGRVPDIGSVIRVSAIVGGVIGFLVPAWYRKTRTVEGGGQTESDKREMGTAQPGV